MSEKIKLIAVSGPTASGKSALAEYLAERFGGEIISCDSMQIYRTLSVGTAKPTETDRQKTVYHMIDIADPDEEYSCSDYATAVKDIISDITNRKKMPIICGGTGLYLDSVINPTDFSSAPGDEEFRKSLDGKTNAELYEELLKIDPKSAEGSHENNRKRNIRALEIFRTTGKTKSEWDSASRTAESPYLLAHITLISSDRSFLYSRIEKRVDQMMSLGLLDEAKSIDFAKCRTAAQAIGYKEFIPYINGDSDIQSCIDNLKKGTRNYAKRQLTWFSRYKNAKALDISVLTKDELFDEAEKYIKDVLNV